jgi:hypothetical protein
VDNAVEFWRHALSSRIPVQTEEEISEALVEQGNRHELLGDAELSGDAKVIELARENLAATAGLQVAIFAHTPAWQSEFAPAYAKHREAQLERFEHAVKQSRDGLEHLADAGADIVEVLDILIRYVRRSSNVPAPWRLKFRGAVAAPEPSANAHGQRNTTSDAPNEIADAGPAIVGMRGRGRIARRPPTKRKSGPAETEITYAMALITQHLRRVAGRPHWRDLAELFNWWALDLARPLDLTGKHVKQRVLRVRNTREFRHLSPFEAQRRRAISFAFERFKAAKIRRFSPPN